MKPFHRDDLTRLMAPHEAPCITICMPTAGRPPGSQQDPVRFANAVRDVKLVLERDAGRVANGAAKLLERLSSIADEEPAAGRGRPRDFWNSHRKGLAVFASPDHFSYHHVSLPLREVNIVGDSFHVKPLLPLLYDDMRYHVLALRRGEVQVYEGGQDFLHELPMQGIPRNLAEAVGTEFDDSHQGSSFHGSPDHGKARSGGTGAPGATGTHAHGYGGSDREIDTDLERFFREIDRAVLETYSQPTGYPLILAAVEQHHPFFHALSHNRQLVSDGIHQDPRSLTVDQMREQAWAIFEPLRRKRLTEALDTFGAGTARGTASADILEIARAAAEARVNRLLLEHGRRVWGRLDREKGQIDLGGEPGSHGVVDVLDDLAEVVLLRGGDVLLVDPEDMPVPSGVAATYRY